ncbi:hypothetical protein EDB85DRAFT_2144434 [Lactarius pseudohatsudake]|nr:hypothetical protein EDB85DRAFT_2144434 [Lactarius pseudohatsudake]
MAVIPAPLGPRAFPAVCNNELTPTIIQEIEEQVYAWAHVGATYDARANTPTTREDMWGHSMYLDDDGLHVQRLREEEHVWEVQAGDAQNIILGGDALAHGELIDLGLPEADINDDDAVPGSGWRRALADEPYPMDIPLVGGGQGRPTVLGSEGAGQPAYSSGLYARPYPREQHTPDDDSLALYDSHHTSRHDIDLALARLGNPGVCAEVLQYHGSA